jgi:TonB family protein
LILKLSIFISLIALGKFQAQQVVQTSTCAPPLPSPTITCLPPLARDQHEVFTIAEQMPEFPGGKDSMNMFVKRNLHYPENAIKSSLQGKCYVRFVVNEVGGINDIQVIKGVPGCHECDKEAGRVIHKMPAWRPGQMNGKPVKVFYTMPVNFVLQNTGK